MTVFIVLYVLVACAAALIILKWNVLGFQMVVLMSLVHFGIGDSAFLNELDHLKEKTNSRLPTVFVFLAFGSIPVVWPLVNSSSTSALAQVNVNLVNWHQGFDQDLRLIIILVFIVALVALLFTKRFRDVVDLFLLSALAVLTPPLIAPHSSLNVSFTQITECISSIRRVKSILVCCLTRHTCFSRCIYIGSRTMAIWQR